jgi:hypothetical protein
MRQRAVPLTSYRHRRGHLSQLGMSCAGISDSLLSRFVRGHLPPLLIPPLSLACGNAVFALGILSGAVQWLLAQSGAG